MNLPGENDLRWLRKQLTDPNGAVCRVVINGYVDEVTDWLGGLVKLKHDYDQLCLERNWYKRASERKPGHEDYPGASALVEGEKT